MTTSQASVALAAVLLGVVCTGCALPPEKSAEAREDKIYRTGSNLPVREGQPTEVRVVDPKSMDNLPTRSIGSPMQKGG